jgi:hypothetical protein
VVILETSVFTKRVMRLMSDEEYRLLQAALVMNPALGAVIPGTAGLRKVRWSLGGKGKRGGARVIYYWARSADRIMMLFIFAKGERDDLTDAQLRILRQLVEKEYP